MPLTLVVPRSCAPSGPRTARRLLCVAAAGASTVVLAGCTAELNGVLGLTVDDQGRVTAAMAVCEGSVDGMVLYDESSDGDEPDVLGRWTVEAGPGLTLMPLSKDGSPDRAAQLGIIEGQEVSLNGYGGELRGANRWFAPGPYFTAEDLATLRPGVVLWESYEVATTDAAEFGAAACDDMNG